jgi:gliding motility-associated-like protein
MIVIGQITHDPLLDENGVPSKISIDHASLLSYIKSKVATNSKFEFIIPSPSGEIRLLAQRNEVMDAEFIKSHPDLITLDIFDNKTGSLVGCTTISPFGIYVLNLDRKNPYSLNTIDPAEPNKLEFSTASNLEKRSAFMPACAQQGKIDIRKNNTALEGMRFTNDFEWGSKLNRYRVAVVCTGEFYVANGNADGPVITAITNSVNSISAIFRNELSVILEINSSRIKLFNDPNTDPFTPDKLPNGVPRPTQASQAVNAQFSSGSYDIGHVFHTHAANDDWSSGGVAYLQAVCDNKAISSQNVPIIKAGGWSGSVSNKDYNWYQLSAHEFAHMFGAEHTFNGIGNSCTNAIGENSAVEIGSGTTIMSYSGTCAADQNIPSGEADGYFHTFSLKQMAAYITGEGGACATTNNSANSIPVADANPCGSSLEIPKGTAFYLKGKATDADANPNITYTWEQMDEDGMDITPTQGLIGPNVASETKAPLFRCFPPTNNPERYFPSLGTPNLAFEVLPQVARNLNFAFTVRDNRSNGGAVGTDEITIKVNPTGPFVITKPTNGENVTAGQSTTILWNTNGSQGLCANLRIRLSIDGGYSFPTVLAENIPYPAGTYTLALPSNTFRTNTAVLMMECMDKDCVRFYDLSTGTFTIQSSCSYNGSVLCPITKVIADQGSSTLNFNTTKYTGNSPVGVIKTITDNNPSSKVAILAQDGIGCTELSQYYHNRFNIYVTETGTYTFKLAPYIVGGKRTFASIFKSNYNPNSPCSSFVASSAISSGGNSLIPYETFTANLTGCTEYVVLMHSYQLPIDASIASITGPGIIIEKNTLPPAFSNYFIILNKSNNTIAGISNNTDLTTYPGGIYEIYSANIENLNVEDIPSLIGTSFSDFTASKCLTLSSNVREVEIRSSCIIQDISVTGLGGCEPATNKHTLDLSITYDKAPTSGKLSVNGQEFDITSSPQSIKLTNIESDGTSKPITALFTSMPSCALTKQNLFTSPPNCCPAIVELGADITKCVGDIVTLDGGNTGASYKWYKDNNEIIGQVGSILSVTSPGKYTVKVTHATGCARIDSVNIIFNAPPTVVLPSNLAFCEGTILNIQPNIQGGSRYQWLRGNTPIVGEINSSLEVTQAGSYTIVVTSANGCSSSATTTTATVPKPIVELGPPIQKCESDPVILDAGSGAQSYEWYKDGSLIMNASLNTYRPIESGIYRVVVTSGANCSAEDQVNVMFFASPDIVGLNSEYKPCAGNPFNLMTMISGQQSITWYYNNSPIGSSNNTNLTVNNSGTYIVEAVNNIGCKTRDTALVSFIQLPTIPFGPNVVACQGNTVELNAGSEGTMYQWSKDNTLLANTSAKLVITQNGTYAVTVTNAQGCSSTAQKMVTFIPGPTLDLGGDTSICQNETYDIVAVTNASSPNIRWLKDGILLTGENNLTLTVDQGGTYEAIIVGGNPPCEIAKTVVVSINPKPGVNLGQDKTLCEGMPIPTLDAGPNHTTISWSLNGTALGNSRTIMADKSGLYRAVVTNSFGCSNSDDIRVTINPLPTLNVNPTFDLCQGDTLLVNANSNGSSFQWKIGTNIIPNQTSSTLKVQSAGSYTVVATSSANCTKEANFMVTSRPSPSVDLGPDFIICPNKSRTLNAGSHTEYLWSTGSTESSINISSNNPNMTSNKSYAVTVKNQFGCDATDSVKVKINRVVQTIIVSDKAGVCNGAPVVLTSTGGGDIWSWSGPQGTISDLNKQNTTVSPSITSLYKVIVKDSECPENTDSASIKIEVFEAKNITAGKDTSVVKGRKIKLNASGGVTYEWSNKNLIEGSSTIMNPVVKPTESTTFVATITDANGCEYVDSVYVRVIDDPLSLFKAVTFISPNDDGSNDFLYFLGLESFPENRLTIYNRWGNIVFEKNGYQSDSETFDGTKNGERLPADTYYYILEFADRKIKSALTILWPE